MTRKTWGTLVLAAALGCGGGDEPSTADFGAPEGGAVAEAGGADESRIVAVEDMPTPDTPREYVAAYETHLTNMLEVAKSIRTPEEAREHAAEFAENIRRMEEMTDAVEEEASLAMVGAFASRAVQLASLTADLAVEMNRISEDPELRQAFSEALDAYDRGN